MSLTDLASTINSVIAENRHIASEVSARKADIHKDLRKYHNHMIAAVALEQLGDKEGADKHWSASSSVFNHAHAKALELHGSGAVEPSDQFWSNSRRQAKAEAHDHVAKELS